MNPQIYLTKQIVIFAVFIVCMYCGFHYHSGWAFFGAVLAFLSVGNSPKDK